MRKKSFIYLGIRFEPVGVIVCDFFEASKSLRSFGISNYKDMHNEISSEYNYDEFYKQADCELDVFYSAKFKKYFVPCNNELFEYRGSFKTL